MAKVDLIKEGKAVTPTPTPTPRKPVKKKKTRRTKKPAAKATTPAPKPPAPAPETESPPADPPQAPPADPPEAPPESPPEAPAPPAIGRLQTRVVPVDQLLPAPYNPRKALNPGDAEYQKIKRSIQTFSYVDPIIWNQRSGYVVGGHQRLTVMKREFGITEAEVSVVDLSDADERALNVALNKIDGQWDESRLRDLMLELQAAEYDATVTGYDDQELEALLGADALGPEDEKDYDTSPQLEGLEFRVIIQCQDETQQRSILQRLQNEGLTVSAMTN